MSVVERLRSRVETVFVGPLSKHLDTSAACVVVLADSSLRQEHALAYRAVVDAVYAEAALDVETSTRPAGRVRAIIPARQ